MKTTAFRQNELLDALAAVEAETSRTFAARLALLAELADVTSAEQDSTGIETFVSMELAGTCRKGRVGAGGDLADAVRYVETLPETVRLLADGRLYVHQARVLLEVTANTTPEVAQAVERRLLPAAVELAPPDLRRAARRAVLAAESELDSQAVLERLAKARARRRVWVRSEEDGMALIGILAPAEQAARWSAELDRMVLAEKAADRAAGIWRSADQIRVDLLMAMPGGWCSQSDREGSTGQPGGVQPRDLPTGARSNGTTIVIHVPAATVLGYADAPGDLDGYGPLSAEHVRLLLPNAQLRRLLVDQHSGQPLATDIPSGSAGRTNSELRKKIAALLSTPALVPPDTAEPQHDPSARLRRFVQLRDRHCRGVGCTVPARRCHLDHRIAYPAGPTDAANLHALSASCHRAKHAGWQPVTHPDGSTSWTSPLGRTYHRPPPHQPPPALRATPRPPVSLPTARTSPPDNDEHGDDEPLCVQLRPNPAPPPAAPSSWPNDPPPF